MKALAAALLLLPSLGARAEEVVLMLPAVAPAVIAEGPFAGLGGTEVSARLLGRALPQFQWRYEVAAPPRILHEIGQRDGICAIGVGKTPEREAFILFNNRPGISPGYGLILREDRLPEFQRFLDADGAVDLRRLTAAQDLRGGYPAGRPPYGAVKEFIEKTSGRMSLDGDTNRLFRQLKAKHLDYLFGARDEPLYFAATMGEDAKFVSLPIAGLDRFGKGYFACSKGALGEAVIAAVNAYLADDAHWAALTAPWERWLSPADYAAALASPVVRQAP